MSNIINIGTTQLLNTPHYLGLLNTQPSIEEITCYVIPVSGTLSNFYIYQGTQNYSRTYPDGDASSTYKFFINSVMRYAFVVPGTEPGSRHRPNLSNVFNTTIHVNAGDKISCKVIPSDSGTFVGGSQHIISCIFTADNISRSHSVSIGQLAGQNNQGSSSVAIGEGAGSNNQGSNCIAIGNFAGNSSQGNNSIAIGQNAGAVSQDPNTIIINATGNNVSSSQINQCFINPIRNNNSTNSNFTLSWNTSTAEVSYNNTKTFVIQHPINKEKHLVHACVESPNTELVYRGVSSIDSGDEFSRIYLPEYVEHIGYEFTVNLTTKGKVGVSLATEGVIDGKYFDVYGEPCKFFWHIFASRTEFDVEPNKKDVTVNGDGPYTWIR